MEQRGELDEADVGLLRLGDATGEATDPAGVLGVVARGVPRKLAPDERLGRGQD
ncbi:MAG TPA: hypothetical protein VF763_07140 [Candidatus Limnocylindrales bacterium]